MITEFSQKMLEALKRYGLKAAEHREYYRSDAYDQFVVNEFITNIPRDPDFAWYDNPVIRDVGQEMGYASAKQLHEAMKAKQFDEAIREER